MGRVLRGKRHAHLHAPGLHENHQDLPRKSVSPHESVSWCRHRRTRQDGDVHLKWV